MALHRDQGILLAPSSTGNLSVSSLDFTPELVMFYTVCAGDATLKASAYISFGVMDDSGNEWFLAGAALTGQATSVTSRAFFDNACIGVYAPNTKTKLLNASYVSMNSDGFTINFDTTIANVRVHWVALAGFSDVKVGTVDVTTTESTQSFTDPGFEPDALIFGGAAVDNSCNDTWLHTLGFCDVDLNQYCYSNVDLDGQATTLSTRAQSDEQIVCISPGEGSGVEAKVVIDSFDTNGFTIDKVYYPSSWVTQPYGYVAMKGVDAKVDYDVTPTTATTKSITDTGFTPEVGLFFHWDAADYTELTGAHAVGGIGSSVDDGSETQGQIFAYSVSTQATSLAIRQDTANLMEHWDSVAEFTDMDSFDSGGFTIDKLTNPGSKAWSFGHLMLAGYSTPLLTYHQLRQMGS